MSLPNQIQDAILSCDISCLFKLRTLFGLPDYQLRIFVITIVTVHSSYIHVSLIQKVMLSHYHTFRNSIQRFLKGPHFIDQSLFIIYLKYPMYCHVFGKIFTTLKTNQWYIKRNVEKEPSPWLFPWLHWNELLFAV